MVVRALVLGLIMCGGLSAQAIVNTSGAAGGESGSSTIAGLTDVDETARTEDDILKVNAGGDYINTNILTAIGEDLATAGCVAYESGGSVGCSSFFKYDGNSLIIRNGNAQGLAFGNTLYIKGGATGNWATYASGAGQNGHKFFLDGTLFFQIGGSQTLLVQDTTSGSGDTLFEVWGGDTESGNLQVWGGDDEVADAYVTEAGAFTAISYGAPGAAIWYGASATEPVNCTASNDGSMYFDTGDQALCVCMNDGTDDEWLMSSDPAHATGHCTP